MKLKINNVGKVFVAVIAILAMALMIQHIIFNRPFFAFEYFIFGLMIIGEGVVLSLFFNKEGRIVMRYSYAISTLIVLAIATYTIYQIGLANCKEYLSCNNGYELLMLPFGFYIITGVIVIFAALAKPMAKGDSIIDKRSLTIILSLAVIVCLMGVITNRGEIFGDYSEKLSMPYQEDFNRLETGNEHYIALLSSGKVKADGANNFGQCNVSNWTNIKQVEAGNNISYGLTENGRIVMAGNVTKKLKNANKWSKIVYITACDNYLAGITSEGKVRVAGSSSSLNLSKSKEFKDIKQIVAGEYYFIALKNDGSVEAVVGEDSLYSKFATWNDVDYISGGRFHVVGVKHDGEAVAEGIGFNGICDIDGKNAVRFASASGYLTTIVKANGNYVTIGDKKDILNQINMDSSIVSIKAEDRFLVTLSRDKDGKEKVKIWDTNR